ncbi:hypothetical protein GCM10009535_58410 [Streptomyces thermocarboxydovorans]|uniref:Uncharacterized protein n=1 Tax=Streptomyces thermocarboxydovorans TaxID=59298 RepID=A0ABN1HWN3_9ACTN
MEGVREDVDDHDDEQDAGGGAQEYGRAQSQAPTEPDTGDSRRGNGHQARDHRSRRGRRDLVPVSDRSARSHA